MNKHPLPGRGGKAGRDLQMHLRRRRLQAGAQHDILALGGDAIADEQRHDVLAALAGARCPVELAAAGVDGRALGQIHAAVL